MTVQTETADLELNAGFTGDDSQLTETPAEVVEEVVTPEYAQITKEEYDRLKNTSAEFESLKTENKRQLDTAFGKIGNLQQALTALQTATPAGQLVSVSEDDFAELKAEFPELAAMQIAGLNRALGKLRGTGGEETKTAEKVLSSEDIEQMVGSRVSSIAQELEQKTEIKLLTKEHKDWREVTKSQGYRDWLGTQPAEYQEKINNSWDSDEVGESLTTYKAFEKAKAEEVVPKKEEERPNRFKGALQPKGDGGLPEPSDGDDDFMSGFNSR